MDQSTQIITTLGVLMLIGPTMETVARPIRRLAQADQNFRRWIGLALMPQTGFTIGVALIAMQTYPHLGKVILPIILDSTAIFEILDPLLRRKALFKVGETKI